MSLNVLDTILQVTKPLGQINLKEVAQKILEISSKVRRETNLKTQKYITYTHYEYKDKNKV